MLGIGEKNELPTILLVDDDLVSREVIATVLTLHGHMVHSAEDGDEALQMLRAGSVRPGLVLLDTQLPGLSGSELIAKLRQFGQDEIILISGTTPSDELIAAADGFLLKPFAPEDLQKLLNQHNPKIDQPDVADAEELVINPTTLAQFRQLMTESTVREIYIAVVTDLHKRLEALEKAIATGNIDEVRRIGHAIKGGCGMAGCMQAARLGAIFETKSEGESGIDQLDNFKRALLELYSATQRLERMLEKEFPA
ncbi:response regulator [Telmatobacter sp. DSM 110680]|uniref:Response regulator n=1 Tax=Telmatobacter sp. DSM 110680 TaxID=3036704 RepID=A0AAU7DNL9_9BACT